MSRPTLQTIHGVLGPLKLKQFRAIRNCGASLQDIQHAKAIADSRNGVLKTKEETLAAPVHQVLTILSEPRHD